eukprot:14557439-Ditylum_brightwellii.AAC.1
MSANVRTPRYSRTMLSCSSIAKNETEEGPHVAQPTGWNIGSVCCDLFEVCHLKTIVPMRAIDDLMCRVTIKAEFRKNCTDKRFHIFEASCFRKRCDSQQ